MINWLLSLYSPNYPSAVVYMLQGTEYQIKPYFRWYLRTTDFKKVMIRRKLDNTRSANLLLLAMKFGIVLQLIVSLFFLGMGLTSKSTGISLISGASIILYPFIWAALITLPLLLGNLLIAKPKAKKLVALSKDIFASHNAKTIAVLGSYGKTSMKEMLLTVLSCGLKVEATPANKNVPISHAHFAKQLSGDEDILIIEYGEGKPGDIIRFAQVTSPDIAIITGLAPVHLDHYLTIQAAGDDLISIQNFVSDNNIYANAESVALSPYIKKSFNTYDSHNVLGWHISNVKIDFSGTHFLIAKDKLSIKVDTKLLGRHQVGPLSLVIALASKLGLSPDQIKLGISKIVPVEHRMQPRNLAGAWIIDDAYNGNIEGMKAGLNLLSDLPAKKRIYVTPGLVDQGSETKTVHKELGRAIAQANPDQVILMDNSVTSFIKEGMSSGDYMGVVKIENDPLKFYTNLEHFIANGDVVMLQNDWTDNYN